MFQTPFTQALWPINSKAHLIMWCIQTLQDQLKSYKVNWNGYSIWYYAYQKTKAVQELILRIGNMLIKKSSTS